MRENKYTKEFRDSAVQLVLDGGEKPKSVAYDLGLNLKTLYHWIRMYKKEHNLVKKSPSNSYVKETEQEELKRLRKENKLLRQERDILKKATAYFAKGTL